MRIKGCVTSAMDSGESSRASEQEIGWSSLPTGSYEQACLPGAEAVGTEPGPSGNGGAGVGGPDLYVHKRV